MKKKEARGIIVDCARIYKEELLGKNLLFAFKEKSGDISYEEMIFQPRHFLHLTGEN